MARKKAAADAPALDNYTHPEANCPTRPEAGTQAHFKGGTARQQYRYDSSLSPALDWDGQNSAREEGEALIRQVLEATTLAEAKAAAGKLKALGRPFLNWAGKAERQSFEVPTLPLFVHERLSTKAIVEALKGHRREGTQRTLFGWVVDGLRDAIRPDTSQGEAPEVPRYEGTRGPGSTADVNFWTAKDVREVQRCHLNYAVADTARWEQQAAYLLDHHPAVAAFVKNQGLGFAIPYFHNGQDHDYYPDFLVRLVSPDPFHVILETKGYDPLEEVKRAAAERWVAAVNAEGSYGRWRYVLVKDVTAIGAALDAARGDTGQGGSGPGDRSGQQTSAG